MGTPRLIDRLERFAQTLPAVVGDISPDDARWRPGDGAWSILEIVNHMADEEVGDFRTRLELTLRGAGEPWPPIDPEGWAIERRYNEQDPSATVDRFVLARRASVSWLRSLERPDWSKTHEHPKLGCMRAGDILAAWTAHDALHLRQIAKRLYQMIGRDAGEYSTRYAGQWTA